MTSTGLPPCRQVGRQCRGLRVTLRVATLESSPASADHEATWLLGHTDRIGFGPLVRRGRHLYATARLAIPCRFAHQAGDQIHCRAFGFRGRVGPWHHRKDNRQLGGDEFEFVERGRVVRGRLPIVARRPSLPVVGDANPCATAGCRTADGTKGAACCRDLQLEIVCPPSNRRLESLVRARQSPYLCKVERESPDSLGVEVISACSYLEPGGPLCSLHDRRRSDGRTAKPDLCYEWPDSGIFHRQCALKHQV
jgi:hypothetical protein